MRITRVTATPVRMPIPHAPYPSEGAGTKVHWDGKRNRRTPLRPTPVLEYNIVRIETDSGVTGIGEAQADIGFFGQTVEEVTASVEDYLGPQLVGKDPYDREHLMALIDFRGNSCAKAGIDMALHDLVGKSLGAPVSVLLGGQAGGRVAVAIEIAGGPAAEMARACQVLMEQGVRAFKAKIGGYPDQDAERLCAIREAVGRDVSLRADANQGYTPKEAIRFVRLLERESVALELLEQPVPSWDVHGMAFVRRAVDVPIEADESCYSIHDAMELVRHEAADVLNVKIGKAGGLQSAKKIAAIAESAGLRCVLGTAFGLGPEIAAKLHLAASTALIVDAVEFTELSLHENLLVAPDDLTLPLRDGRLEVPRGPGLGVTLDEDAVEAHRLQR
ncbi:MAG: dipeptide epimerase [Actinomycetota bacterium]|nr:dipeptide epimerase [Actinomycetota bacterium]